MFMEIKSNFPVIAENFASTSNHKIIALKNKFALSGDLNETGAR
jgi:hypothetical protein